MADELETPTQSTPSPTDHAVSQMTAASVLPNASGPEPADTIKPAEASNPSTTPQDNSTTAGAQAAPQTQPQQNQPTQPSPKNDLSKPPGGPAPPNSTVPSGTPNADHPAVQMAGVTNSTAIALMGGRRYRTVIDTNTGETNHVPVPVSRGDVAMAIAMQAISGAMAGLGQSGPNAVGKAAAAGLQQGEKISAERQQAQKQQDAQANADYQRKAMTAYQNAQSAHLAAETTKMGAETMQQIENNNKDVLDQLDAAGELPEGRNVLVTPQELTDGMKSGKYQSTDQLGVQGGHRLENGRLVPLFAVVTNPQAPVAFTQELADKYFDGIKVGDNAHITAGQLMAAVQKKSAIDVAQKRNDDVAGALEKSPDAAVRELGQKIPPIKAMLSDPATGAGMRTALSKLQSYTSYSDINHNGRDYYQAWQAMQAPVPDPRHPGQFMANPNAAYAGQVAQLFGGADVLKAYHNEVAPMPQFKTEAEAKAFTVSPPADATPKQIEFAKGALNVFEKDAAADVKAKGLALIDTPDKAMAVLADKSSTPQQRSEAQGLLKGDTQHAAAKASAETYARTAAELAAKKVQETAAMRQAATETPSAGGIRQNYLSTFTPEQANLLEALASGKQRMTAMGLSRPQMAELAQQVQTAFPNTNQADINKYYDLAKDVEVRHTADAANQAMEHLGSFFDAAGKVGYTGIIPGLKKLRGAGGDIDVTQYNQAKERAGMEVEVAYRGAGMTDQAAAHQKELFMAASPKEAQNIATVASGLLMAKYRSVDHRLAMSMPSSEVPTVDVMDNAAHEAYKLMHGTDAESTAEQNANKKSKWYGRATLDTTRQPQSVQQPQAPVHPAVDPRTPAGATPGWGSDGKQIGYKQPDGTVVRF